MMPMGGLLPTSFSQYRGAAHSLLNRLAENLTIGFRTTCYRVTLVTSVIRDLWLPFTCAHFPKGSMYEKAGFNITVNSSIV